MATSLQDYLSQLPVAKRGSIPTDQECALIASKMSDWEVLIPDLGLPNIVMSDIIDANPRKPAVQRIEVLRHYKQAHGSEATFANLVESFYGASRRDLVDKVIEVAQQRSRSRHKHGHPTPPPVVTPHPTHVNSWYHCTNSKSSIIFAVLAIVVCVVGAYSLREKDQLVKYLPNFLADVVDDINPFPDRAKPEDNIPKGNDHRCNQHRILVDANQLRSELSVIGDWESLCSGLRLPESVLSNLRYEHGLSVDLRKLRCLETYLKTNCPNWVTVIEVVCNYPFHDKRLGKELAKNHRVEISSVPKCLST